MRKEQAAQKNSQLAAARLRKATPKSPARAIVNTRLRQLTSGSSNEL
jgi:hypothetical protein